MELLRFGAELPAAGAAVVVQLQYAGAEVLRACARPEALPRRAPLTPEMKALLRREKQLRSRRTAPRPMPFDRRPYHFYSAAPVRSLFLPQPVLQLPSGLAGRLSFLVHCPLLPEVLEGGTPLHFYYMENVPAPFWRPLHPQRTGWLSISMVVGERMVVEGVV